MPAYAAERIREFWIGIACEGVELAHHLVDRSRSARTGAPDVLHAERTRSAQVLLDIAHDFQRRLVG